MEQELYRLRIRYKKQGRLKYLGHLEVLHSVERIIRRAKLPYAITQGFSPHMKIAFGTALPVGTASDCEFYDLFLTEKIDEKEALQALIAASPKDLAPNEAQYQVTYGPAITTELTRADYRLDIYPSTELTKRELQAAVEKTLKEEELQYARGRKTKTLDLSHTVKGFDIVEGDGVLKLAVTSHSDNEGSLRPDIFLQAIDAFLGDGNLEALSLDNTEFHHFKKVQITRTLVAAEHQLRSNCV